MAEPKPPWFTSRTVPMHVAILVVVPGFLALSWWQLERALHGNTLSWAYTFEWPVFAGYAVYMWWDLVHDARFRGTGTAVRAAGDAADGSGVPAQRPAFDDQGDAELAEYNRYLAGLAASGRRKTWRG